MSSHMKTKRILNLKPSLKPKDVFGEGGSIIYIYIYMYIYFFNDRYIDIYIYIYTLLNPA